MSEDLINGPVTNEVTIVIVGQEFEKRDIVLEKKISGIIRIAETHRPHDSFRYPLIFWQGDDWYNLKILQQDPITMVKNPGKKVYSIASMHIVSRFVMTTSVCCGHVCQGRDRTAHIYSTISKEVTCR